MYVCVCACVGVCAKNIWADGIKFPSAQFTPCGPRLSQCSAVCVCVCVCVCVFALPPCCQGVDEAALSVKVIVLIDQ